MTKIKIFLNGELTEIEENLNISQDLEIINPQDFEKIFLNENAKIEIVHFIGGG